MANNPTNANNNNIDQEAPNVLPWADHDVPVGSCLYAFLDGAEQYKFTYKWNLENFGLNSRIHYDGRRTIRDEDMLQSPTFKPPLSKPPAMPFHLRLYTNSTNPQYPDHMSLYLHLEKECAHKWLQVTFKASILDRDGNRAHTKCM